MLLVGVGELAPGPGLWREHFRRLGQPDTVGNTTDNNNVTVWKAECSTVGTATEQWREICPSKTNNVIFERLCYYNRFSNIRGGGSNL